VGYIVVIYEKIKINKIALKFKRIPKEKKFPAIMLIKEGSHMALRMPR